MANDYEYITDTGVIVPDTASVLTGVQDEYKAVFGSDLNTDPSTPQGILITAETLARDRVIRNNAALANQINPNLAGGVFLDAICALSGLQRDNATKSYALVQLTGVAATSIPEGSQVRTADGDIFESTETVVLDVDGNAEVSFQSVEFGPIAAPANTLVNIVSEVLGWETATNADPAILGTDTQTDQSLRALRKVTLAGQGVALSEAIISGLYEVPEVRSLSFRENITGETQTIDGVELVEHSIYVCVDGGTNVDVATELLAKKSLGCNWNGSEEVEVVEPVSGQTYTVKFDRPLVIDIAVRATVSVNTALINPTTASIAAILAYANGELEGEAGLIVGADVSPFELAGAINREAPGIFVSKIEIDTLNTESDTWTTNVIPIAINEIASIVAANIEVIVE